VLFWIHSLFCAINPVDLAACYQLLGLEWGSPLPEIKAAYRRLARQYHPDMHPHNPTAVQAQFVALTHAYEQLLQAQSLPGITAFPAASEQDQQLKRQAYRNLQPLLRKGRFARAVALIEGLAIRLPDDPEVRQWQAIAYYQWGKSLIDQGHATKAKIYLRKALRTDPHNRTLWAEVEHQVHRLAQVR
jgi:tetratricopeptide (TPR) repeat protein